MPDTIEIGVGNLYAELHDRYSEQLGDQYEQRIRQEVEDFLHNFNQQVERQMEQAADANDVDVPDSTDGAPSADR